LSCIERLFNLTKNRVVVQKLKNTKGKLLHDTSKHKKELRGNISLVAAVVS
jgi:hypothetical protein